MKSLKIIFLTALILAIIACDTPMGMGDPIDFEAPELILLEVELADGQIIEITKENGKMFVGPGILFGKGAVLKGKARDNIEVVEITAQEIGTANLWTTRGISGKDSEGWQSFSLNLSGLGKGERELEVTAYDRVSLSALANIGPDTVKQITLLVDTDPPFINKAWIEKHPGIFANLLPKSIITELEPDEFESVDFFQNEKFTVMAEISHEYSLSEVTLNLVNEAGETVFSQTNFSNLFTPSWTISANDLISVNPSYSAGRHYFAASISAKAEAGHSGQNDITNNLYNLCWNPESDAPVIQLRDSSAEPILKNAGGSIPVQIFDDDSIEELYYSIVPDSEWTALPGTNDETRLENLKSNLNLLAGFNSNKVTPGTQRNRNIIKQITVSDTEGMYRLAVIAKDGKKTDSAITTGKVYRVRVIDTKEPPCELISVICENPNGAYKLNDEMTFKLIFSGKVYSAGTVPLTIHHGSNPGDTGSAQVIEFATVAKMGEGNANTNETMMRVTWEVKENLVFAPVRVTNIDLTNVKRADNNNPLTKIIYTDDDGDDDYDDPVETFNKNRTGLKIMSVRPTITKINDAAIGTDSILVPDAANNISVLKLEFSHPVWPENGTIRVRTLATTDYLIPPVLTNDEYSSIASALGYNVTQNNTASPDYFPLHNYYTRTTHGLQKDSSGNYINGSPDTDTKFVLNFSENLTDTTNSATIRDYLNNAKFRWQEIDVTDSRLKGSGSNIITVDLDKLPDGRIWKIEIVGTDEDNTADGAFRDEAGNTFAGWGATGKPNATNYRFWSFKTAEPVIRVQRVSNNRAHSGVTHADAIFQTNVNYRIDCETPGAAISYGTSAQTTSTTQSGVATVPDTAGLANADQTYRADSDKTANGGIGYGNSNIADFTLAQLQGIGAGTSYTANSTLSIGDNNSYTARKDYIAAKAELASLGENNASFGYEGAFKTVIVYRDRVGSGYMKIEATDTQNGPVTVAGFPMEYNDMSGKSSKHIYRNGANSTDDWIWISWEMVTDFWHVAITRQSDVPYSPLVSDPWEDYGGDWYNHNYRKYGNYGLRVGNFGTLSQ